jgi:hypothetical protein
MTRGIRTWSLCLVAALLLPAVGRAGPVVDGAVGPGEYGTGGLLSTQRFQTGFGDDQNGDQWGGGSELDQLFVTNDNDYLYIGLSGNLENNGNCVVIFIDVDDGATGAFELYTKDFGVPIGDLPRYLGGDAAGGPGFDWVYFDPGFAPNYALGFSGGSPLGSQTRSYYLVNWTTLAIGGDLFSHDNDIAGMITAGDPTASGPSGTLGDFLATATLGILGAGDNSGVDGVEGNTDPNTPPQLAQNDPATQVTGFEVAIPLSLLGVGLDDSVCVFAMVSGADGWFSNQMLPPPETETEFENPGNRNLGTEAYDFGLVSGNQFVCYTISEPEGCPNPGASGNYCTADIDGSGDCLVTLADLATLLASYNRCPGDPGYNPDADLVDDGDGCVNLSDLAELLGQYGDDCN